MTLILAITPSPARYMRHMHRAHHSFRLTIHAEHEAPNCEPCDAAHGRGENTVPFGRYILVSAREMSRLSSDDTDSIEAGSPAVRES